jgi:undecaprenyl diphosphate synthase
VAVRLRRRTKTEKNGHVTSRNGAITHPDPASPPQRPPRPPHVPRHVAIIMDGNGRWAKERGLSRQQGHRSGAENIRRVIRAAGERGIEVLTLYAFSTENWTRPRTEVSALIRLIPRFIKRELKELHENGVRLVHIGDLNALDSNIRKQVEDAIELTKDNDVITVALAFNYGGRAEIVEATRRIVASGTRPEDVDEEMMNRHLFTAAIGDPDLVVRTGGEMRLSNFLIWQSAYAEFYTTETYWPDFDEQEFDRALEAYARRERRFGGVEPKNGAKPHK